MQVSDQMHAPATLPHNETPIPTDNSYQESNPNSLVIQQMAIALH